MSRPVRRSVSIAIRSPLEPDRVLVVQRPQDDPDLPAAWGLPAASLRDDESFSEAAHRAAREKLGVSVRLGAELRRGSAERAAYTLEMRLFAAEIEYGQPSVPQRAPDVTQYAAWGWGDAATLRPAAERGSLCCRLYLESAA